MSTIFETVTLNIVHCASCGVPFAITADYEQRRREDHRGFFCPSGHSNVYDGQTDADKLRAQLELKERALTAAKCAEANERNAREKIERKHKRVCRRVHNGVCPCCNRTFSNLARHMATKHPEAVKN